MIELLAVARRTYLRLERPESNPRLVKEKETDKKLTQLAQQINVEAAEQDQEESDNTPKKRKAARA